MVITTVYKILPIYTKKHKAYYHGIKRIELGDMFDVFISPVRNNFITYSS